MGAAVGRPIALTSAVMTSTVLNNTTIRPDDFDAILLSELEAVRQGEQRLRRLYPRLGRRPQLREFFLSELSEVQQRARRLHAVLNPCEAFESLVKFPSRGSLPAA